MYAVFSLRVQNLITLQIFKKCPFFTCQLRLSSAKHTNFIFHLFRIHSCKIKAWKIFVNIFVNQFQYDWNGYNVLSLAPYCIDTYMVNYRHVACINMTQVCLYGNDHIYMLEKEGLKHMQIWRNQIYYSIREFMQMCTLIIHIF